MSDIVVPFEETQKCFQCGQNGEITLQRPIVGGTLHSITCRNSKCDWFNTSWLVETDSNGEVRINEKAYKQAQATRAKANIDPDFDRRVEAVQTAIDNQIAEEQRNSRA
jgi:hypothetical protein